MLRAKMAAEETGKTRGWHWRSHEIMRIEGFSDAVFGFAVTLLIISLEVPKTYSELSESMHGFLAFAISFALLFQLWFFQYQFFRRFGLQDTITIVLNAALLFTMLFYVYPLKFLFRMLVLQFSGESLMATTHNGLTEPIITVQQIPELMMIYGWGVAAVFGTLGLLYCHALRQRDQLQLSEYELYHTKTAIGAHFLSASVGLVSVALSHVSTSWAGMAYPIGMSIGHTIWGTLRGRGSRMRFGF